MEREFRERLGTHVDARLVAARCSRSSGSFAQLFPDRRGGVRAVAVARAPREMRVRVGMSGAPPAAASPGRARWSVTRPRRVRQMREQSTRIRNEHTPNTRMANGCACRSGPAPRAGSATRAQPAQGCAARSSGTPGVQTLAQRAGEGIRRARLRRNRRRRGQEGHCWPGSGGRSLATHAQVVIEERERARQDRGETTLNSDETTPESIAMPIRPTAGR